MSLMRWEPFRSLRRREDPFDDLFREFFRQPILEDADGIEPAAEMAESDGEVTVARRSATAPSSARFRFRSRSTPPRRRQS